MFAGALTRVALAREIYEFVETNYTAVNMKSTPMLDENAQPVPKNAGE
jgi:hypothetical protein